MMNQSSLRTFVFAILVTLTQLVALASVSVAIEKPNVVLIYIDDLGYGDTAHMGAEFPTKRPVTLPKSIMFPYILKIIMKHPGGFKTWGTPSW